MTESGSVGGRPGGLRSVRAVAALGLCLGGLLLVACPAPDYDPPVVEIVQPAAGDTVAVEATVRAVVRDRSRVVSADFYAGTRLIGSDSTGSADTFSVVWNTSGFAPGSAETLSCAARDAADNVGRSAPLPVVIGAEAGTRHRGIVAAPETWTAASNPHVIDQDLFVEALLRLEPGVRVLVLPDVAVRVGTANPAGLIAEGTADSLVTLTALDGSWRGIEFRRRALPESCRLRHCVIESAGTVAALVTAESCGLSITDCRLRQSPTAGVVFRNCGPAEFRGNTVSGCAALPVRIDADWAWSIDSGNTISGNARDGIEVPGGTVSQSAAWQNLRVPWCVTADLEVIGDSGPVLTIAPGCSLLFADSAGLHVADAQLAGGLRSDGSSAEIVFSRLNPAGAWRGIEFRDRADTLNSLLRFSIIEHTSRPALNCYGAAVAVSGCRVADCGGSGVAARDCGFRTFTGNTVTNCSGYAIEIDAGWLGTLGPDNSLSGNGRAGILVNAGAVARSAQWRNHHTPYVVGGNIEVGAGSGLQLTIDSGVELRFENGAGLCVGRTGPAVLRAVGTPDSILFTGVTEAPGAWRGLELHTGTGTASTLERCRLLYAGGNGLGNLFVDSCTPRITGNEIGWSGNYCIYLNNTTLDPDSLRQTNWLHDWAPGADDIYDAGR
jgi:hypothetical protein